MSRDTQHNKWWCGDQVLLSYSAGSLLTPILFRLWNFPCHLFYAICSKGFNYYPLLTEENLQTEQLHCGPKSQVQGTGVTLATKLTTTEADAAGCPPLITLPVVFAKSTQERWSPFQTPLQLCGPVMDMLVPPSLLRKWTWHPEAEQPCVKKGWGERPQWSRAPDDITHMGTQTQGPPPKSLIIREMKPWWGELGSRPRPSSGKHCREVTPSRHRTHSGSPRPTSCTDGTSHVGSGSGLEALGSRHLTRIWILLTQTGGLWEEVGFLRKCSKARGSHF